MKHWFSSLPIRFKLYFIVLLASAVALILATSASFVIQRHFIYKQLHDELQTLADVISENSRAGVAFEDRNALQTILHSLVAKEAVTVGRIYGRNGTLYAEYRRADIIDTIGKHKSTELSFAGLQFHSDHAELSQPVLLDNEEIGWLFIEIDLVEMRNKIIVIGLIMGGVLLFGLLLAMVLSSRLLRVVIEPIRTLSEVTQKISVERNYHVRARVDGDDELAMLASGFNVMIDQIEKRDAYLEEQVENRTRELEARTVDLQEAKEKAEAANRAKSQFLANMSHEIRTPMNAIIGMTHLAIESRDQQQVHRFLGTVKSSAESLLGILNDILDFSKIEAGQMQIENRPFNLPVLLQKIVSIMNVPAAEKGLDLRVVIAPDLPAEYIGDDLRIYQILLNLVGNAIKFTARGAVTIEVEAEREQTGGDGLSLHFSVADTGIGIVPDKLRQIFNSFEQVDSSYTRQYGGTGLGLSISRQLTHLMGGSMWVESIPDVGSTFHFSLRLQPCLAVPADPCGAVGGNPGREVRNLRILVVDDNEVNRDLARMLLAGNHHVDTAGDGVEALQALRRTDFDVILMDVQMPLMDGLTTTAIIRDLEKGRPPTEELPGNLAGELGARLASGHIPIVAMTAHAMAGDREMCLNAGMDGYMTKPFQLAQLNEVLSALAAKDPAFGGGMMDGPAERRPDPPVVEVDPEISPERVVLYFQTGTNLTMDQCQRLLAAVRMSITGNLAKAEEAWRDGDYPALGVAAHTLKGTLLQCGISSLANLADEMYRAVRTGEQAACESLLAALRNRLGGLLDEGEDGIQVKRSDYREA